MKQKWTPLEAVTFLKQRGARVENEKIFAGGLNGLKACSAYDYLVNHCGYKGVLK